MSARRIKPKTKAPRKKPRPAQSLGTQTVPLRTRITFGVGSTAETLSLYSLGALGMLFYNQILGLDVLLAGLVPTIAIFADAISDPFIAFPDNAKPGLVGDETLWWLGVVDSPLSILPGIIAAALYAQYRINKSSYEKTRKKLSRRLK